MALLLLEGFHPASLAEAITDSTYLASLLRDTGSPCCTERTAGEWSYEKDIDTHDFTLWDWFWTVKYNPGIWFHCPCKEQFSKPMWWSILYSSAELLTKCPCLDQFSDEDWRRLNILPKLKSRIRTREQFRKLIDLTRHPFRNLKFDNDPLL